jgi:hypothetical protein
MVWEWGSITALCKHTAPPTGDMRISPYPALLRPCQLSISVFSSFSSIFSSSFGTQVLWTITDFHIAEDCIMRNFKICDRTNGIRSNKSVVFNLGYKYPYGYAVTSYGVCKIEKIYYFVINTK